MLQDRARIFKFILGDFVPALPKPAIRKIFKYLQVGLGLFLILSTAYSVHTNVQYWQEMNREVPFRGMWEVEEISSPWKTLFFDIKGQLNLELQTGPFLRLHFIQSKSNPQEFEIQEWDYSKPAQKFVINEVSKDQLEISGEVDQKSVLWKAQRKITPEFPLQNREFHWVSDFPYNR